jgi:hypothetical protein
MRVPKKVAQVNYDPFDYKNGFHHAMEGLVLTQANKNETAPLSSVQLFSSTLRSHSSLRNVIKSFQRIDQNLSTPFNGHEKNKKTMKDKL